MKGVRRGAAGLVLLVALVLIGVTAPAAGREGGTPTVYAGPEGRQALDGPWTFRRDPADQGLRMGWAKGGFAGAAVSVPFVPDAEKITGEAGIENHQGSVGWYRTRLNPGKAGPYVLRFESVNHDATIWLDGREVGRHRGQYLPFELRVDLTKGPHELVVRADWRDPEKMKQESWHRLWFNFGGIAREVTLRRLGDSEVAAPTLRTRLTKGGDAKVYASAVIRNVKAEAREVEVRGTLRRGGRTVELDFGTAKLPAGGSAPVKADAVVDDPELWSPGSPALWELRVAVPEESAYRARVGLREVRRDGKRLLLNGKRLVLHGASVHEDVPGRGDGLLPTDQDRVVRDLRRIGANATRAQHPMHPALLERLDEAGIVVWQGIGPVDAPGSFTSKTPALRRAARQRVLAHVRQGQLHPSIITWNLANEVAGDGHPDGQAQWIDDMAQELHRRDPGRPVALDIWGAHPPKAPSLMYDHVDLIGWTNYLGWYEGTYAGDRGVERLIREKLARLRSVFPDKVIAVTEFGAEGNTENAAGTHGSLRYQAALLRTHFRTYRSIGDLSGALVWNLRDFAVAPSFAGGSISRYVPSIKLVKGLNQKGLLTYDDRPKPAAEVVRRIAAGDR